MIHQQIRYTNHKGQSVDLFNNVQIVLTEISGLDELGTRESTKAAYRQQGETWLYSDYSSRDIHLSFYIKGFGRKDYLDLRQKVIEVFDPIEPGTLWYKHGQIARRIKCKPESTPTMPISGRKFYSKCNVDLVAYDPFWYDAEAITQEVTTWEGGLAFPFSLPFTLRGRGENQINAYNRGHTDTPVVVAFHGPANAPTIRNITTGEFIRVERNISSAETLYISTDYGKNRVWVEKDGVQSNATYLVDEDSSYFLLVPGDNVIAYETTDNTLPQQVSITYCPRYLGI